MWSIVALGSLLRFATLGRQSLWVDEGLSYWMASRPLPSLVSYLGQADTHPPLHYLVLQLMIRLGGEEWLLRLPSAVAGTVSIWLLYALGAELFDRRTGLLAAGLLALSPLHVYYAQEARMYALVGAFILAAGLFAARALRTDRPADWAGLVLCQALALWTNTAALWFTLALNAAVLPSLWRRPGRGWRWLGSQALAGLLYLPWLPSFLQQVKVSAVVAAWIPPATTLELARTLADFVNQGEPAHPLWLVVGLLAGLALALASAARPGRARRRARAASCIVMLGLSGALAIALWSPALAWLARLWPTAGPPPLTASQWTALLTLVAGIGVGAVTPGWTALASSPRHGLLLSWLLLPLGLAFAISQPYVALPLLSLVVAPGNSLFLTRNLTLASFPLLLLLARGLTRAPAGLAASLLVVVVALNLGTYQATAVQTSKEDWRGAAAWVARQANPDDLILFTPPYIEAPFAYYYAAVGRGTRRGYPFDHAAVHGEWTAYQSPAEALGQHQRVWLVTARDHRLTPDVIEVLTARWRLVDAWQGHNVTVRCYDRPDAG